MSEAHSFHKEMNNPYKNSSLKIWRGAKVSEYMLRHILHVPLNKESRHAEPGNEFTFKHKFWIYYFILTFWHRSFIFNSNKSPTWCNNFSVYHPDVCLQLNIFWAFSRPSSGVVNTRQDNKLKNCCIRLVIYLNCTMMHGLTNLKFYI